MQYRSSARAATFAAAALVICTGTPAFAQIAPPRQPAEQVETVVVTGSRILRTDTDTPAPIQTVTAENIANSGLTSVSDVLARVTANGQGNLGQSFSGAFAAGASGVALRGMTVDATLVLVDGHRMANYPISDDGSRSFVDVANLPLAAIDRIEVLKDGASAVYGSDAIAGVVNVILKKTFTGLDAVAEGGTSYKGDGTNEHASLTYGFGDLAGDGHNTYINLEFRHQQALSLTARPRYSNFDYYHEFGPDAPVDFGVVQPGAAYPFRDNLSGMVLPYTPGNPATVGTTPTFLNPCPQPQIAPLGGCPYSLAAYTQIQPETTNYNVLLRHTMNMTESWTGVVTASMFQSKAEQLNPPSRAFVQWPALTGGVNAEDPNAQPILIPVGNPNNPYPNNPAWLSYRFGDVGPATTLTDTKMYRLVADLQGEVAGWHLDASIGAMRGLTDLTYENYVTLSGLNAVLANNSYIIGPRSNNFESVYQTLAPTRDSVASSQLQYLELGATRTLFDLPGGPLALAFGGGIRHDGQDVAGQPGSAEGDVIGFGTTFIHGTETNENVYVELNAPFLKDAPFAKSLELDVAGRFDNYALVGHASTPKVGLKWQPIEQIMLRGTFAKGFRAPGPGERGDSGVTFFSQPPPDDLRCPFTNLPSDCGSGSASGIVLGNPNLRPETSKSYTVGIVLTPIREITMAVDWWQIKRRDEVLSSFGGGTDIRGPVQAAFPNLPGPVISITAPYENLGQDAPKGIDYELHAKYEVGPGTFGLDFYFSHLISQQICQTSALDSCADVAGTHGPSSISGNTGTPRNRAQGTLEYNTSRAGGGINVNFVGGYSDTDPTLGTTDCLNPWFPGCRTTAYKDYDLFGHVNVTGSLQINAHILNVLNSRAPFDPQAAYGQNNYNFNFASQGAIGRFFELGVRYTF